MDIVRVVYYQYSLYFKTDGPVDSVICLFALASLWFHSQDIQECGQ